MSAAVSPPLGGMGSPKDTVIPWRINSSLPRRRRGHSRPGGIASAVPGDPDGNGIQRLCVFNAIRFRDARRGDRREKRFERIHPVISSYPADR